MGREVVITGFGVLSAFGFGAEALRKNVFAGIPGFRPVSRFDARPYRSAVAAESGCAPRQRDVFLECARTALGMAGLSGPLSGSVLMGTQGDFTGLHRFWQARQRQEEPQASEDTLAESVAAFHPEAIGRELQVQGRRIAFTNGCVAASNAILHGSELIATGREELVLAGGCYLVDEEFFAKFDSGRAFARDGRLRAFSADRSGLLLGDGAAVLVLEEKERALRRGARPLARVAGWGMASDAFHVCQPHPEGTGLANAIRKALKRAALSPAELGYVNAHGTGTKLNDAAETNALKQALGEQARHVPVSSTKTMTGHTLEASGALEAVISLIALQDGCIPPTAGYTQPDPGCDLDYVPNEPRAARLQHVMSINAAFGGVNTALVLGNA
ncbi:MAG: beta-ketoacyl-[acyl-carrier-protein] synthase family protein [Hyalangium sp.]|uniref:beta-ketoacyl-[acyl-carrier-protein] synthase family protein n=1 Tax=Hyalangium sp. TaxID=2028555 RepID=UPI00389A8590